jgi:hypothetical protein
MAKEAALLAPLAGRIYDYAPQQNAFPLGRATNTLREPLVASSSSILQAAANFATASGLLLASAALFTALRQNRVTQEVARGQNFFSLITFLQDSELRVARERVLEKLAKTPLEQWTLGDESAASKVCSSYDAALIAVKKGWVDREIFEANYGPSIADCYRACAAFVTARQVKRGSAYWDEFVEFGKTLGERFPSHS